jgi:heme-degrading monooxygenase HmoA
MAKEMLDLAQKQDGFLGVEQAESEIGITASHWGDLDSIKKWKNNERHLIAQQKGQEAWYQEYCTRIALVEREYSFDRKE